MRGLPANIPLGELQKQRMEAIGPTHDTGNPTIASEFFDTRPVNRAPFGGGKTSPFRPTSQLTGAWQASPCENAFCKFFRLEFSIA